ncbi:MAG: SDR family NAD(P)-dependent oxidoreductase, partial [Gemmatimonadaceae bacterium]|nr:SDR family NAD(P)-dependent oxidoreductase [Gemmatimonadaceae bacterium]
MSHASTFLLLGGAGGIGAATARRLVSAGHRVVLAGRSAAPMDALAAELGAGVLATHVADLTTFDAVEQAAQAAQAAAPADAPLVGVANLVGSILLKPAHLTREDEYAQVIAQNLTSAFATVRAAAKVLPSGGAVPLGVTPAPRAVWVVTAAVEGATARAGGGIPTPSATPAHPGWCGELVVRGQARA